MYSIARYWPALELAYARRACRCSGGSGRRRRALRAGAARRSGRSPAPGRPSARRVDRLWCRAPGRCRPIPPAPSSSSTSYWAMRVPRSRSRLTVSPAASASSNTCATATGDASRNGRSSACAARSDSTSERSSASPAQARSRNAPRRSPSSSTASKKRALTALQSCGAQLLMGLTHHRRRGAATHAPCSIRA